MKAYFKGDKDVLIFEPIPQSKRGRPKKDVTDTNVGKTNADHIRSMTDEELAMEFARASMSGAIKSLGDDGINGTIKRAIENDLARKWLYWLKQPYREEMDKNGCVH